ncbi:MAG: methyltransferase [Planctomycetota bacterium]
MSDTNPPQTLEHAPVPRRSWLMRLWLWVPDWVFRVAGVAVFVSFISPRVPMYLKDFWSVGSWFQPAGAKKIAMPWGTVLVDVTYLLIVLGFVFRIPPRTRAARPREIVLPMVAAFWPFVPWWILGFARQFHAGWADDYSVFMMDGGTWTMTRFAVGSGLIILGNALDVWGYATLLRSLSIVAEARVLKVHGPYRIARHPIYLGQFLAQGGMWLFYANTHAVWIAFWAVFVTMQLVRSKIEEGVLERAFGETYRQYKAKTFWFV